MRKFFILFIFTYSLSLNAMEIVFEGYPVKKIQISENESVTSEMSESDSKKYKVVVVTDGEKYYWATRENKQVIPVESGFYITYLAINGSGYIRTLAPSARNLYKQIPEAEKQKSFLYFEHFIHQMGSITYYGR